MHYLDQMRPWLNTIVEADARVLFEQLPPKSIHCAVTSPPYFNMRVYEAVDLTVWGGNATCEHEWDFYNAPVQHGGDDSPKRHIKGKLNFQKGTPADHAFCTKCGAWFGSLGNEPTLDRYISNMSEICAGLYRVLRDDGTFWLNLGDGFNESGGAGGQYNDGGLKEGQPRVGPRRLKTYKPGDLLLMPFELASRLREDGWCLRREIIWAKGVSGQKNISQQVMSAAADVGIEEATALELVTRLDPYVGSVMPESAQNRPTTSHEYIFLFTKSHKPLFWVHPSQRGTRTYPEPDWYYFQGDPASPERVEVSEKPEEFGKQPKGTPADKRWKRGNRWVSRRYYYDPAAVAEAAVYPHDNRGARTDARRGTAARSMSGRTGQYRNLRSVWQMLTSKNPDAHFAVFPLELPTKCLLAGAPQIACPECGAPWATAKNRPDEPGGYFPTCDCCPTGEDAELATGIVLDMFNGTGSTTIAAIKAGRAFVGSEISPYYAEMSKQRCDRELGLDVISLQKSGSNTKAEEVTMSDATVEIGQVRLQAQKVVWSPEKAPPDSWVLTPTGVVLHLLRYEPIPAADRGTDATVGTHYCYFRNYGAAYPETKEAPYDERPEAPVVVPLKHEGMLYPVYILPTPPVFAALQPVPPAPTTPIPGVLPGQQNLPITDPNLGPEPELPKPLGTEPEPEKAMEPGQWKCKEHTRYQGKNAPKSECERCWAIFRAVNPAQFDAIWQKTHGAPTTELTAPITKIEPVSVLVTTIDGQPAEVSIEELKAALERAGAIQTTAQDGALDTTSVADGIAILPTTATPEDVIRTVNRLIAALKPKIGSK